MFDYNTSASLDYREGSWTELVPGVDVAEIEYASPAGGTVTGVLAVPRTTPGFGGFVRRLFGGREARPAIVVMHGMPGSARASMAAWGTTWAQRGSVVLAIDAPWARRGRLLEFTPRDSAEQVQLIEDLRRGVDILVGRDDVDPDRIGFSGVSYGAAMGALLMGVEPRFATAVLRVGGGGLVSRHTDSTGAYIEELAEMAPEAAERWIQAMRPMEPSLYLRGAAGRPILYQAGERDPFVPPDDSRALHAVAPQPKTIRWYDAGHGLNAQADDDMVRWMVQHLGIEAEAPAETIPVATQPPPDVQARARDFGRWFVEQRIDSLWTAMHPQMKERYPDYDEEIRAAAAEFRSATGREIRRVAERFVWRDDRRQYWQTFEVVESGRQVVLRLVLLTDGLGIAGWGWDPPDRVPPVDSAGPVMLGSGG